MLSYCLAGKGQESLIETVVQSCSDWFCWAFCSGFLFVCLFGVGYFGVDLIPETRFR